MILKFVMKSKYGAYLVRCICKFTCISDAYLCAFWILYTLDWYPKWINISSIRLFIMLEKQLQAFI